MSIFSSFKSVFIKRRPQDDFELAASFKDIAGVLLITLAGAKMTGSEWAKNESAFMAGYLQGVGDVIAQACGRESGSNFGANIALQFAKVILEDANNDDLTSFIEFSMNASGSDFSSGLRTGGQDGNGIIDKTSHLPRGLVNHFGL